MQFSRDQIEDTFWRVENTLQHLLPGSDYHPRYQNAGSVGLSLVVPIYSGEPLGPLVTVNNLADHPEAWSHEEVDYKALLGRERRTGEARFDVFALAKLARLMSDPGLTSSFDLSLAQPQVGQVGFAGAVRNGFGQVGSASGLWELHDDQVIKTYLALLRDPDRPNWAIANTLRNRFNGIAANHQGIPANDLTREDLQVLLEGKAVRRVGS